MASEANLALLREAKLLDEVIDAGPNDLLITLRGAERDGDRPRACARLQAAFEQKAATRGGGVKREAPRSLEMGLELEPGRKFRLDLDARRLRRLGSAEGASSRPQRDDLQRQCLGRG